MLDKYLGNINAFDDINTYLESMFFSTLKVVGLDSANLNIVQLVKQYILHQDVKG